MPVDLAARAELAKPRPIRVLTVKVQPGRLYQDKRLAPPQIVLVDGISTFLWLVDESVAELVDPPLIVPHFEEQAF